ncbi:MAG: hypothetical protein RL346_1327, partial [Verrucomicrobiota bacterium]
MPPRSISRVLTALAVTATTLLA